MRCFVAVTVGARITEALAAAASELRAAAESEDLKVAWTRPEGWHVTLKFLGETTDEQAAAIGGCLDGATRAVGPIAVTARGLIALPRPASPRVLAVACHDDGRLASLASAVDEALEPLGFGRENNRNKKFVPHLTIARIRDSRASFRRGRWQAFGAAVAAMAERDFGEGEVSAVGLYRSELGPGPARYELIESFELDRPTAARCT